MEKTPSQMFREHLATLEDDPTLDPESGLCMTGDVSSNSHEAFWLQVYQGMINFPHQDSPEMDELLGSIIDEFPIPDDADLNPGNFMTFNITSFSTTQLDQLIDRLVERYFGATGPESISWRSEEF